MKRRGFLKGLLAAPLVALLPKAEAKAEAYWDQFGKGPVATPKTPLVAKEFVSELKGYGVNANGDAFAEDVIKNGWSDQQFFGKRWHETRKAMIDDIIREEDERFLENVRGIAGDQVVFDEQVLPRLGQAVDPEFLGKSYVLEDEGMYLPREPYMLEFFAYQTQGGVAIGHTSTLSRVDFS